MSVPASRRRAWIFRVVALLVSVGVAFGALELWVRLGVQSDEDGNLTFRGGRLRPHLPPVAWVRRHAEQLRTGEHPCFRYHPALGWTNNPRTRCHRGLYTYDRDGLRSDDPGRRVSPQAPAGVLRVGLFGDSFTHGDEEPLPSTWGVQLETALADAGVRAQVLNFGVSGYGLDQAFLRWREDGTRFDLDVVVLGFQSENVLRAHNIIRALYFWHTQLPFSKPRFVRGPGGGLELVNVPALPPEAVPEVLADLPHWDLREHEAFYLPERFERHWWQGSRLLGYLAGWKDHERGRLYDPRQAEFYAPGSDGFALTLAILDAWQREAEAAGSRLVLLHLPKRVDLQRVGAGEPMWHDALRQAIAKRHPWVETEAAMLFAAQEQSLESLFNPSGHYAEAGNLVVARALAQTRLDPPPP